MADNMGKPKKHRHSLLSVLLCFHFTYLLDVQSKENSYSFPIYFNGLTWTVCVKLTQFMHERVVDRHANCFFEWQVTTARKWRHEKYV